MRWWEKFSGNNWILKNQVKFSYVINAIEIMSSEYLILGFPDGSWRRKWQPTPVLLPGESHGGRSLIGYSPWGCKESDTTEWLHTHTHTHTHTQVVQMVKKPPAMQETWVRSLGWEDLLEKEMATHSSILAWRTPWTEEPDGLQSMGLQRVGHDWVTSHTHTHTLTHT